MIDGAMLDEWSAQHPARRVARFASAARRALFRVARATLLLLLVLVMIFWVRSERRLDAVGWPREKGRIGAWQWVVSVGGRVVYQWTRRVEREPGEPGEWVGEDVDAGQLERWGMVTHFVLKSHRIEPKSQLMYVQSYEDVPPESAQRYEVGPISGGTHIVEYRRGETWDYRVRFVTVPYWSMALVAGLLPAAWAAGELRRRMRRRRARAGLCPR